MNIDSLHSKMLARAKKFRWNIAQFEEGITKSETYPFDFSILNDFIIQFSAANPIRELNREEALQRILHKIYSTYKAPEGDLRMFGRDSPYSNDVYDAYLFSVLSYYLHTSKRIDGKKLLDFVRDYHPQRFHDPDSQDYNSTQSQFIEDTFRKARQRHLSKGSVYYKFSRGSAISKDAEYEWSFWYALDGKSDTVQDTFKRFGNLYNDIDKAIDLTKKDSNKGHLREGYKKFISKLQKLKYKNYLELIEVILSHINGNKKYYCLNLYRLERKLQPYKIINEVNGLLTCQPDLEDSFLWMTVILGDTTFPKLYQDFASLPCRRAELYADEFPRFLQDIVISSCLILDELVEKGTFGDDWENLFRTVMNELAENILYDPNQLDFSIKEGSQENFEKLLAAPVFAALCREAEVNFTHFDMNKVPF